MACGRLCGVPDAFNQVRLSGGEEARRIGASLQTGVTLGRMARVARHSACSGRWARFDVGRTVALPRLLGRDRRLAWFADAQNCRACTVRFTLTVPIARVRSLAYAKWSAGR